MKPSAGVWCRRFFYGTAMSSEIDISCPAPRRGGVRELLAIAFPMVVSQACETLMMFVDRAFLSRLGARYMAAAMGGGVTVFMFMTLFIGLTGYTSPLVAQYLGAGRKRNCAMVAAQALIVCAFAYPVILACIPLGGKLFRLSGIAAEQLAPQEAYFRILMFGAVIGLARHTITSFFSGIGRTRIVMVSTAVAMAVNILSNYVLIFGKLGFPAMGIQGAAVGTLLGTSSALAVTAGVFFSARYRREFGTVSGIRMDASVMKKLLRYGLSPGVEMFLNVVAFNVLVMSFHSYGVEVAASVTIAFSWDLVSFVPLIGVHIAVMSLVGRYMGAGDPDTAHKSTIAGLKLAVMYAAFTFTIYLLLPHYLVRPFLQSGDQEQAAAIAPMAVYMIRLITVYIFGDALTLVFSGALKGAGDTFWTMCISVSGHWVMALGTLVMIHGFQLSPRTAWAVAVFLIMGIGAAFLVRYRMGRWREMRVVDAEGEPLPEVPLAGD